MEIHLVKIPGKDLYQHEIRLDLNCHIERGRGER